MKIKLVKLATYTLWPVLAALTALMVWRLVQGESVMPVVAGTLAVSLVALYLGAVRKDLEAPADEATAGE